MTCLEHPAMINEAVTEFYSRLVAADHGPNVINRPGFRPRGSYTRATPGNVGLLVVLQNPGQPLEIEKGQQAQQEGEALARTVWNMTGAVLDGCYASTTFSKMRRELAELLGIPEARVYDKVMVTNLVRCTTINNKKPDHNSVVIGIGWLRDEIELWRPRRVMAYGKWVYDHLRKYEVQCEAYMPHPAALGKWLKPEVRRAAIEEARKKLQSE